MKTDQDSIRGQAVSARQQRADALLASLRAGADFTTRFRFSPPFRLFFYVILIVALIWPRYFYLRIPGLPGTSPFVILSYAGFLLFLLALIVDRGYVQLTQVIRRSHIAWAMFLGFVAWRFLTSAMASPVGGIIPLASFFRQFPPLAVFFLLSALLMNDGSVRRTSLRILLVMMLVMALGGFVEIAANQRLLPLLGLDSLAAGGVFVNEFTNNFYRDNSLRAQSIFTHPLVYGQFAGAFLPFCIAMMRNERWHWRFVAMGSAAACLYGVYISTARSGLLVLIISLSVYALLTMVNRTRYRWFLLAGALAACSMVVVSAYELGNLLASAVGHTADNLSSANARKAMLEMTMSRASDSPWVGYGDGTSSVLAGLLIQRGDFTTIDSLYMSILLQNGYPGLFLWFGFMIVALIMAVRNGLEGGTGAVRDVNCAIAALLAGMMVGLSVLSIEDNMSFVYLMAGIVMVDRLSTRSAPSGLGRTLF